MASIPESLINSELFGHEKGAFTGATHSKPGRFEQANGGTLFLDEIGDMPFETQTSLLRVLSSGEFYRVGGSTALQHKARIIAASHQNMQELIKKGAFREDLFYRLNVVSISVPTLTERKSDIPILTKFFLAKIAKETNLTQKTPSKDLLKYLQTLPWKGNIRELENLCWYLHTMISSDQLEIIHLPEHLHPEQNNNSSLQSLQTKLQTYISESLSNHQPFEEIQSKIQQKIIQSVWIYTNKDLSKTSQILKLQEEKVLNTLK